MKSVRQRLRRLSLRCSGTGSKCMLNSRTREYASSHEGCAAHVVLAVEPSRDFSASVQVGNHISENIEYASARVDLDTAKCRRESSRARVTKEFGAFELAQLPEASGEHATTIFVADKAIDGAVISFDSCLQIVARNIQLFCQFGQRRRPVYQVLRHGQMEVVDRGELLRHSHD